MNSRFAQTFIDTTSFYSKPQLKNISQAIQFTRFEIQSRLYHQSDQTLMTKIFKKKEENSLFVKQGTSGFLATRTASVIGSSAFYGTLRLKRIKNKLNPELDILTIFNDKRELGAYFKIFQTKTSLEHNRFSQLLMKKRHFKRKLVKSKQI